MVMVGCNHDQLSLALQAITRCH